MCHGLLRTGAMPASDDSWGDFALAHKPSQINCKPFMPQRLR
jgi:hypothetical protein